MSVHIERTGNCRLMNAHNDDLLYDSLPQPYRFINKILVKTVEDAIDLAEGGGSAEALSAFVCHNLRLTKVGKIPTNTMDQYILSTDVTQSEATIYSFFANTKNILAGTTNGTVIIYSLEEKQAILNLPLSTISKSIGQSPIVKMVSLCTDHDNYVVALTTEETAFLLFISPTYQLKGFAELDISVYNIDSLQLKACLQPYIYITDGTGRCAIYNVRTPADLTVENANAKTSGPKAINIDPVYEFEKCPISTGPVTTESNINLKVEDPTTKKKPIKKKAPPPAKGTKRAKSPGTIAVEAAAPLEITHYQATVVAYDDLALIKFGTFELLLLFNIGPTPNFICEFSLPAIIKCMCEIPNTGIIVIGFENGSFCFLNMKRKCITGHIFQRKGAILEIHASKDKLFTFTDSKSITAYQHDGRKTTQELFSIADESVLQTNFIDGMLITLNGRPSDVAICSALTANREWEERNFELIPNVSIVDGSSGAYAGTTKTPANLDVLNVVWGAEDVLFVLKDPKECLVAAPVAPAHGKRGASPKGQRVAPPKARAKGAKPTKEAEETKEPEPMVALRREVLGVLPVRASIEQFTASANSASEQRRAIIHTLSSVHNSPRAPANGEEVPSVMIKE